MSKEGTYISYTGEEAHAVRLWEATRAEYFDAFHAVSERLAGQPDMREHVDALETRVNALQVEWTHVLHARLVRVLPHLADVLTFLLYPEFMPTPSWVDPRGLPHPWTQPYQRDDVDDEMDGRQRQRQREREANAELLSAAMRGVSPPT